MFRKLKSKVIATVAISIATLLPVTSSVADETKVLNFGIISTESSQNLKDVWQPFLEDMSKTLGVEVKPFFAPDYAGVIQGMRFDKVDVAWYGNKSAMEAVDRAGGEIFAQTVDVNGNPGYWSLLVTHKDSPINNVEDMLSNAKDLTFGNGDPNSTSGFLVPSYYVFAKNNVDAKSAFKRVLSSNHQTNLLAAATKKVDVATNNTENYARLKKTNPEDIENIKIIWKSPLIPSDPIVWRKNLDDATKGKIKDFVMGYGKQGSEREEKILAGLGWKPFKASNDDQLIPIRQLVLFKNRLKIEKDTKFSAEEKASKLAEIDDKLKALSEQVAKLESLNKS